MPFRRKLDLMEVNLYSVQMLFHVQKNVPHVSPGVVYFFYLHVSVRSKMPALQNLTFLADSVLLKQLTDRIVVSIDSYLCVVIE